jgi:hypothetical protein
MRNDAITDDVLRTRQRLSTPRAAAVAGVLFAVLMITSLVLLRLTVTARPSEAGTLLSRDATNIARALNLLPFAGIAFLWFIGVVRDHLGDREDRLFATVFLGSGLLFVAMLFASAAMAGGLIVAYGTNSGLIKSETYTFARTVTYQILDIYAVKMAGVFMISSSSLWIRTGIIPRWIAYIGYLAALMLLFTLGYIDWIILVFPLWVLLISVYFLIEHSGGRQVVSGVRR